MMPNDSILHSGKIEKVSYYATKGAVSGIVDGVHDFFSEGGMTVIVPSPTENLETFSLGGRFRPYFIFRAGWTK
jgi:hypothetical protein